MGEWPGPAAAPRERGRVAAQHVPRCFPECHRPRRQQPDQEGAGGPRAAVVVEHGDRLPGVLRERQRVLQARGSAAVSGSRPVSLEADLERVNAFPRVAASPYALEWWNAPGRTAKGAPKIPLLRIHEIGDPSIPPSLVQGYDDLVRANGRDDLYRTAYVQSPSHCGFTAAETMAAIETIDASPGHRAAGGAPTRSR